MKTLFLHVFVFALSMPIFAADSREEKAEVILKNGYVYTVNSAREVAEAVAISGQRILAVGSNEDIAVFHDSATKIIDLDGRMVLPGLHDTHIHALGTIEPDICDFKSEPYDLDEMVVFLKGCITDYNISDGDWLLVAQWNFSQGNKPSATNPTIKAALDAVSETIPIFMFGNDGHHAATNTAALSRAISPEGNHVPITADTLKTVYADFKELIAVDAYGEPSGGLNETARLLVRPNVFGDLLGANRDPHEFMPKVASFLASRGITSIQDPLVTPDILKIYTSLEDMGKMTFRMRAALFLQLEDTHTEEGLAHIPAYVEQLKALRAEYSGSELIHPDGVKVLADAVLEGNPYATPPTLPVAAILGTFHQPLFHINDESHALELLGYVDPEGEACHSVASYTTASFVEKFGFYPAQCTQSSGVLEHSKAFLKAYVKATTEAGFNLHIHALSDAGVRVAVDALEAAHDIAEKYHTTQSLAHLQLVHPTEKKRIGDLGLYTNFTFSWAKPFKDYDMTVIPFIDKLASEDDLYSSENYYMQNVYPAKTLQDNGAILVAGSDAPVGSRDPMPFANIASAITRANEGKIYNAAERITIHDAIAAYTINGAAMLGQEDKAGSIEAGKLADLIVLDQNIVELAKAGRAADIAHTSVDLTFFNGGLVFEKK